MVKLLTRASNETGLGNNGEKSQIFDQQIVISQKR